MVAVAGLVRSASTSLSPSSVVFLRTSWPSGANDDPGKRIGKFIFGAAKAAKLTATTLHVVESNDVGQNDFSPAAAAATVDAAVVAVTEVGATAVAVVVVAADQELTEWDTQSEVLPSRW